MLPFSRILALRATLVMLALAGGCTARRSAGNDDVPPELAFEDVSYRVYRGPLLAAEGTATRASLRRDTADLTGEQVTVRFPPTRERSEARLAATALAGNLRVHAFRASGGVRAEQPGQTATAPEAAYEQGGGLVHGERGIEVRRGGLVVRGPAFTLDPRDERLQVVGGARIVAGEERR